MIRSQTGFTLIELIVSLTVITIIAGIILAGYAKFSQRQNLVAAGQNFKNILTDAQSRAQSSEVDCSICGGCTTSGASDFKGWYVDFDNREIYGKCADKTFSEKSFSDFNLPDESEIMITPHLTPPAGFLFNYSPSRTSSITPSQNVTVCLQQANLDGLYYAIRISKVGIITDDNVSSSCVP
jgi:prepilin-type N-terminal cleavage/methylation domain-containing protein